MLALLRNSIRLSSRPAANWTRPGQQLPLAKFEEAVTCQQCNVSNEGCSNISSMSSVMITRLFGTLTPAFSRTTAVTAENSAVGINGALSGTVGTDCWTMAVGGPFLVQSRGMKYKGKAKRRCKDCQLRWINGVLYNLCKTHPRHKHAMRFPYYANQRILTHATMSPKRPW